MTSYSQIELGKVKHVLHDRPLLRKEDFTGIKWRFKTSTYKGLEKLDLNDALLMSYRQYLHGLERFEALHEDCSRYLRKVVQSLKEMRRSGQKPADF